MASWTGKLRTFGRHTTELPNINLQRYQCNSTPKITVFEYNKSDFNRYEVDLLSQLSPDSKPGYIRWINCEGVSKEIATTLQDNFGIKEVSISDLYEDVPPPQLSTFQSYLFVIMQAVCMTQASLYDREQVSLFALGTTVITLREGKDNNCWDSIQKALEDPSSKLRNRDHQFLIYILLDAVMERLLALVTALGTFLEDIELQLIDDPKNDGISKQVRSLQREVYLLKRNIAEPTQEALEQILNPWLCDEEDQEGVQDDKQHKEYLFSPEAKAYLRKLFHSSKRCNEMLETYKGMCLHLQEMNTSAKDHWMNSNMYVLTLLSAIILPINFISGIYGMNFEHIPETRWHYGYMYFWFLVMLLMMLSVSLLKYKRVI